MALKEILAKFGFEIDGKALTKADQQVGGLLQSIRALGPAISAAGIVMGFTKVANEIDELSKSAALMNMPIGQLQAWRRVADLAGVDAGTLEFGLKRVQRQAFEADSGSKEMAASFDRLGVSLRGTDGKLKSAGTLFEEIGSALAGVENPTERTGLAMEILGRSGDKFLSIFNQGPEVIRAQLAEMEALSGVTQEAASDVEAMNDAMTDVKIAFFNLAAFIVGRTAPTLRWLSERIEAGVVSIRKMVQGTNVLKAALILFSTMAGLKVLGFISRWIALNKALALSQIKAFALIALAILLIDELITTWQGGESYIRDAIDGIFGEGTTAMIVESLKEWTNEAGKFFAELKESGAMASVGLGILAVAAAKFVGVPLIGFLTKVTMGLFRLGAAAWASLGPFAPLVAVILAVGLAINAVVQHFGGWKKVGQDFLYFFEDVWRRLGEGVTSVRTTFAEAWEFVKQDAAAAIDAVKNFFVGGIDKIKGLIAKIPGINLLFNAGAEGSGGQAPSPAVAPPGTGVASVPVSQVNNNQRIDQSVAQSNQIHVTVQGDAPKTVGKDIAKQVGPALSGSLRGATASLSGAY